MTYINKVGKQGQSGSYPVTMPTVVDNDVMMFFYTHTNTQARTAVTLGGVDVASRFTQLEEIIENALYLTVYSILLQASDSGKSLVWTQTGSSKSTIMGSIHRGINGTTPILTSNNEHDVSQTVRSPSIVLPTTADVISVVAERVGSGANTAATAPTGLTIRDQEFNVATGQNDSAMAEADSVATGTVGPYTWGAMTGGATIARRIGYSVALRPIGYTPPGSNPTVQAYKSDGSSAMVASIQAYKSDNTLANAVTFSA